MLKKKKHPRFVWFAGQKYPCCPKCGRMLFGGVECLDCGYTKRGYIRREKA